MRGPDDVEDDEDSGLELYDPDPEDEERDGDSWSEDD